MTTFFEGEIISRKYPFLTRKWEADEEVDKKHWVSSPALRHCTNHHIVLAVSSHKLMRLF